MPALQRSSTDRDELCTQLEEGASVAIGTSRRAGPAMRWMSSGCRLAMRATSPVGSPSNTISTWLSFHLSKSGRTARHNREPRVRQHVLCISSLYTLHEGKRRAQQRTAGTKPKPLRVPGKISATVKLGSRWCTGGALACSKLACGAARMPSNKPRLGNAHVR